MSTDALRTALADSLHCACPKHSLSSRLPCLQSPTPSGHPAGQPISIIFHNLGTIRLSPLQFVRLSAQIPRDAPSHQRMFPSSSPLLPSSPSQIPLTQPTASLVSSQPKRYRRARSFLITLAKCTAMTGPTPIMIYPCVALLTISASA